MPKTVQIRDLDDELYARLAERAAAAHVSVPEYLRGELRRLVARPALDDWLEQTRRRTSAVTRADLLDALDDHRRGVA